MQPLVGCTSDSCNTITLSCDSQRSCCCHHLAAAEAPSIYNKSCNSAESISSGTVELAEHTRVPCIEDALDSFQMQSSGTASATPCKIHPVHTRVCHEWVHVQRHVLVPLSQGARSCNAFGRQTRDISPRPTEDRRLGPCF